MYIRTSSAAAVLLFLSTQTFAQHLSYGVAAGTALTQDFSTYYFQISQDAIDVIKSGGKGVIIGPTLEWSFSPYFSLETDALFRELRFEDSLGGSHNPTVTWEFPILAKYRFSGSRLQPFIEAGPVFRTTGNLNANPSHAGIATGAGFGIRLSRFTIAPTVRYTRWQHDSSPYGVESRPDQIELLAAFTYSRGSDEHPFGNRVSVGAVFGTNLLGDYHATTTSFTNGIGSLSTFTSRSGPRSFLVGLHRHPGAVQREINRASGAFDGSELLQPFTTNPNVGLINSSPSRWCDFDTSGSASPVVEHTSGSSGRS